MRRDMDLIRKILLAVEAEDSSSIDGYSDEQIGYHAHIMVQAGLVDGHVTTHPCLTWLGHDFLDVARDPTCWQRAKAIIEKVRGTAFEVWKAVLIKVATDSLIH